MNFTLQTNGTINKASFTKFALASVPPMLGKYWVVVMYFTSGVLSCDPVS